jgi:hypothetical protein
VPSVLAGAALLACVAQPSPVGPGGECFLASDCAPGLICVEQREGTRVCTDDLSRVTGRPREPEDAGEGEGDGGDPDASTPVPEDAGVDAGGEEDAGADTGAADAGDAA